MANRILGLDIGTYSVKVVHVESQRDTVVTGFDEELIAPHVRQAPAATPDLGQSDPATTAELAEREGGEAPCAMPELEGDDDWGFDAPADLPRDAGSALAEAPAWVRALDALNQRGQLSADSIVTYLPNGKAMMIHLDVPFDSKAKVSSILPHLLSDRLPLDPRHVVYDFTVVPGQEPEAFEAIIGFTRKEQMAEFLANTRMCGVDPVVVGVPELMLGMVAQQAGRQARGTSGGPDTSSYALLDIGHTFTRVLVMHHGKPAMARTVHIGGHQITEAIAAKFGTTYEEAERIKHAGGAILGAAEADDASMLALSETIVGALTPLVRDLRRSFQGLYAKSRIQVEDIAICGGTSRLRNLVPYLNREFGVETRLFEPGRAAMLDEVSHARGRAPVMSLGLSLALQRVLDRQEAKVINLRQGEFGFKGKSSFLRSQYTRLGIVAAVLLALIFVTLFSMSVDQKAQRNAARAAVLAQTKTLFGEPLSSHSQIQARLAGEGTPERGFVPKMSAYELLYSLVSKLDDDTHLALERIEVDTDRNLVQVVGVTTDPQAVDRLVSQFEDLACLREIRKDKLQVRSETEVQFELQISSGCS